MSSSGGQNSRTGKLAAAKSEKDLLLDVLGVLLRDEDNKYCADCDAKSPRWASWNIGIFLCIRCAGIHRKLGVHISRVKSVNLDSWTAAQVAGVAAIGNSLARAAYEANVPDGFRRPQTDATLEQFIKAKYEEKRYLARDWVLPKPDPAAVYDLLKPATSQRRATAAAAAADGVSPKLPAPVPAPARRSAGSAAAAKPEPPLPQQQPAAPSTVQPQSKPAPQPQPPPDLLGGLADDGFGDFSSVGSRGGGVASSHASDLAFLTESTASTAAIAGGGGGGDLFADPSSEQPGADTAVPKKSMKDSIMALYQQNSTSTGGGYLAPPHQQQQHHQQQHFGGMQYSVSTPQLASAANSTGYQPLPPQHQQQQQHHVQQNPFSQQQQQQLSALYSQTAGALYSTGGQFAPPQYGGIPASYHHQQQHQQNQQLQQQQQQYYGFQPPGHVNNQSAYLLQIQSQMAGMNFKGATNNPGIPQQQQQQSQPAIQQSAFAAGGEFWN